MKNIRRIAMIILAVAVMIGVAVISSVAASAEQSGDFKYSVSGGTATITKYTGSGGDVVIPSEIDGYKVTGIGNYAFSGCSSLTSVTIGNSVTSIGDGAFSGCSSLTSITIPDSVTSIGDSAFLKSSGLTSITIPDSVTSIGKYAFEGCSSLKSVTIGNGVTSIGDRAFYDCDALSSITVDENNEHYSSEDGVLYNKNKTTLVCAPCKLSGDYVIPSSVTSIGGYAFSGCSSLTNITIPGSVTSIGKYAFSGCIGLTSITIPDGVISIDDGALFNCTGLTSIIISGSVTSIGIAAFQDCINLTTIDLPDGLTSLGNGAFVLCSSLTAINIDESNKIYSSEGGVLYSKDRTKLICVPSVTSGEFVIPNGVTSIGEVAFYECTGLTNITIPNSVTSIGNYVFVGCSSLTTVYYTGTEAEWNKISIGYSNDPLKNATKVYNYQPTTPVVTYSEGLAFASNGDGTCYVSGIGECTDTDIIIPPTSPAGDKVTSIGNTVFYGCRSLTSIVIPNSVTSIGDGAFYNCTSLISIEIPNSVTRIGPSAFSSCSSLTSIVIPNSVTSIGNNAFTECTSLASIVIPNSVTSIGEWVFIGCSSLTAINVDGNNEYYSSENGVLYNKDKTKLICVPGGMGGNLTIPRGVTIIGECALYGCCITSIEIPDSVISIDKSSFFGCSNLTNLTIPNGVTSIGNGAFSNCSSITNIVIPDSVTSLGIPMFFGCDSLTNIEVSEKNPYFSSKDGVMYNKNGSMLAAVPCGLSGNFVIPSGVTSIGDSALDGCTKLTSIEIPNSVTSIGDYALYFCSSLTDITIPNRVTNIGYGAFGNCTSLISITIPKSVIIIGDRIVDFCDKLTTVYYTGTETEWNKISIGSSNESLVKLTKVYNYTPTPHKHTWGVGVVTKAATCTETGVMTYTCSCGETKTEVIAMLAHTVEIIPGKAATCAETGLTQGEKCSVCQTVLVRQEIIPSLGHDYFEKESLDTTCTDDGYILYECSICHVEKKQVEYAAGHSFGYDNICDICGHEAVIHNHDYSTEIIAPTCTNIGYTLFTCKCGDSYKADYIDQFGHSWGDGVEENAPTCTEVGIVRYTCTVCGESYISETMISHQWQEERREPTCTEDGYVVRTCSICGEVEREALPAEHKWNVKEVIQNPSCDAEGKQTVICSVCGKKDKQIIPAKGHIFQNGECNVCHKTYIEVVSEQTEHPIYGMFFLLDDVKSNYGPATVNEYGVLLYINEGAELDKVAVYLMQDGTMWRRCIACTGNNIEFAYFVPYLSYGNDILYTGLNSPYINTFALKKGSDGIWRYSEYATIGANLADNKGQLLLSLYQIGQAGAKTRIFDDLEEMKTWLKDVEAAHVHTIVTDEEIPATCTNNGMTEGSHCSVCGEIITARELITALGHNYVNGKCTRCGEEEHIATLAAYSTGLEFTSNGDGTCFVSGIGTCVDKEIVIPTTSPSGEKVSSIGDGSFNGCSIIKRIVIPDSVTSIGDDAFTGCKRLTSIVIPNSVTSISGNAFSGCDNLKTIYGQSGGSSEICASENGYTFVVIENNTFESDDGNICVDVLNYVVPDNATLKVEEKDVEEIADVVASVGVQKAVAYEIHFKEGGIETYQKGIFTVSVSIPDGYDPLKIKLYRIGYDGNRSLIKFTYSNGKMVFKTDSFGAFVISEFDHAFGDINNDGTVNNKDVTCLLRYLSEWNVDVNEKALDVNGDGEKNIKDALRLLKFISDWEVVVY